MSHETYERGPKLLAVAGFAVIVLISFACMVMTLASWLFKRSYLLLALCLGCSECRMQGTVKTLFHEVSFCMEMTR